MLVSGIFPRVVSCKDAQRVGIHISMLWRCWSKGAWGEMHLGKIIQDPGRGQLGGTAFSHCIRQNIVDYVMFFLAIPSLSDVA